MSEHTSGLDGVVVADTEMSLVDGLAGRLVIRGHAVEELAGEHGFEDVCHLLWTGSLPDAEQSERLRAQLGAARAAAFERIADAPVPPAGATTMETLMRLVARCGRAPAERGEVHVTGVVGVCAAATARLHAEKRPVSPDTDAFHAADYLRMATGTSAGPAAVHALDTYLATVIDHGMNASTFTARVVASTNSDLLACVVAALGALEGPLHGGAPGPVLDMLDAIEDGDAEAWVRSELAAGRRIMGIGHRVYRVRDPRMAVLESALDRLATVGATGDRIALARTVERVAVQVLEERHPGRSLRANVEFGTALLLEGVGIPRAMFTPTFAVARVAGWAAHVAEQRAVGRLIRPRARYVGPLPAGAAV